MLLFVLAYLGGVFTILSPCILPVLPFVFARSGLPFVRSGLPLLVGMAITFAAVGSLAAVGGGWAVQANEVGRIAALILLGFFGLTLLIPTLADRLAQPFVAIGDRLSQAAESGRSGGSSVLPSFVLGIATGLLWAPCAGPILGLVLTGAALNGATVATSILLLAYAAGAATSLAAALLLGGRLTALLKRSLGAGEWVRRGLGVAVLVAVVAIGFGVDTKFLTRVSTASTARIEQSLIDRIQPKKPSSAMAMAADIPGAASKLPVEGTLPPLTGAVEWLNSPPLTAEGLRGKVVLVDFWTYSCINCLRSLPYLRAWADKYRDQGLVVIGVHAPEFAFERDPGNVRRATKDLGITYPVAIDNNYAIWRAFENEYWPAHYFIDAEGRIRYHHFGEGEYAESEAVIQQLLAEAGRTNVPHGFVQDEGTGALAAADEDDIASPETYVGYRRAENFASAGGEVADQPHAYSAPTQLMQNQWGLDGNWKVEDEKAELDGTSGRIVFRFHARDLHLVLGPGADGKPIRFRVTLDGKPPGSDHGADTDADGQGTVTSQRLYQLVRQGHVAGDRTFEIEFLDPHVQAFAFTFG
ncbi:MAG TPA: cytochrome c biogenesis protein DipZ [Aliidongia sp.]|nr:cytochrome c biogenesis protein DipZ [Aliidongia sp.]